MPATATRTATARTACLSCDLDLEHCHAPLVAHDDGELSCLEACGGPRAVHDVVLACAEVGLGCCEAVGSAGAVPPELAVAA